MSSVSLTVSKVSIDPGNPTVVPPLPRTIVFQIKKPWGGPDYYIGVLTLIENTALNGINAVLPLGTSALSPGACDVQMASNLFGPIWTFISNHTKLSVTITYDDVSRQVTNISVISTLAVISYDLLEAGLSSLGNVDVGAAVTSLAQIAGTLNQALATFAPGHAPLGGGARARDVKNKRADAE